MYDSRGVLRGGCTVSACFCIVYDGGQEMKKCTHCGHPPGRHINLDSSTTTTGASSPHSTTHHHYGAQAGVASLSLSPSPFSSHHGAAAESATHHHRYHYHHQPQTLPQCEAAGCTKPVYHDFNLPEHLRTFKYCSPECRDRELLPTERRKLKLELDELKITLQAAAVAFDAVTDKHQFANKPSYDYTKQPSSYEHTKQPSSYEHTKQPSSYEHTKQPSSYEHTKQPSYKHNKQPVGGSPSSHPKGSQPTQRTVQVEAEKTKFQRFGLLLSKVVHNSDKASGFLIVGAVKDSPAYSKMREDKIRIFDIIEAVNDTPASALPSEYEKEPQECFDNHLKYKTIIKLRINRSISLPPVSNTLNFAHRQTFSFTHILALKCVHNGSSDIKHYGLSLSEVYYLSKVTVKKIAPDSPASSSGVLAYDDIHMYAVASDTTIDEYQLIRTKPFASVLSDLERAQNSKRHLILLIRGYGPSTRV